MLQVRVERPSRHQAIVKWDSVPGGPSHDSGMTSCYSLSLQSKGKRPLWIKYDVKLEAGEIELPIELEPGDTYSVCIYAKKEQDHEVEISNKVEFRAEFTVKELQQLLQKACLYISKSVTWAMKRVEYIYRNKPQRYFDDIYKTRSGIMEPYTKDRNGDPASVINDQLKGLFFLCNPRPFEKSPFGKTRIKIPAAKLLCPEERNLYFADFYCITGNGHHWVTLVLTNKESEEYPEADHFCDKKLIHLDMYDNPFLKLDTHRPETVLTVDYQYLIVELMFTDSMDLNAWQPVTEETVKKKRYGALPKLKYCEECNIK